MSVTLSKGMRTAFEPLQRLFAGTKEQPPVLLGYRSSPIFIQLAVCFVVFTDIFMYGVLVPVLPFALSERAGVKPDNVQHWISILLAVFGAALCVSAPVIGWLADKSTSRRLPFLLGLLLLAAATLMLCLGRSVGVLVAGRFLQGVSGGVVWVVGLTMISDTVGEADAGRAMGYISVAYSIGVLAAPLLGGIVYSKAGYYAVYGMSFAVIGIDVLFRLVLIERKTAATWTHGPDVPLQDIRPADNQRMEVVEDGSREPTEAQLTEQVRPATSKLPPILLLLKSRRMLVAWWGTFVAGVLWSSFDTTLPLFCKRTFGWNSTGAGLIFLCLSLPSFSGPIVGAYSDKYGPRWIAASGFVLALPIFVLLRLVTHNSLGQKVLLCALLTLIGAAFALMVPPIMAEFTVIVEAKERQHPGQFGAAGAASAYATSYGIFNTAWAAGYLVGPFWAGYVETTAGWGTMTWSLGVISAISALPVVICTGGMVTRKRTEPRL